MRSTARIRSLLPLLVGVLALVAGTLLGWDAVLQRLLAPPAPVRALLAVAAGLLGIVLVLRSAERLGAAAGPRELVRGVRIVFLAVAAFAAAGGWLVGSPLPIVAALLIAGIDIVETSFLLLVTAAQENRPG